MILLPGQRPKRVDGTMLPVGPTPERPMPVPELQERYEGAQVARWMLDISLPEGWAGFAFDVVADPPQRWIVAAAPLTDERFRARIVLRLLQDEQWIWTKAWAQHFSGSRSPGEYSKIPRIADMQRALDGAVIHGLFRKKTPTPAGGERMMFEFAGGAKVWLEAVPVGPGRAEIDVEHLPSGRLWLPQ